jgi:hypothetical protein
MRILHAALGFLRPRRTVRRPGLAVLEQRVAAFDQRRQRLHGGGVGAGRTRGLRLLHRHVETGHRVEPGCGAVTRIGAGPHRGAARGLLGLQLLGFRLLGLGGRFPRLLAVLAGGGPDLAVLRLAPRLDRVKLGLLRQVRGPVGNRTGRGHRRTRKLRLRRLLETIEFGTIGTGVFCRGFGHGGNMGRVCGEGKRPEEQKENKNGPY